MPVPHYLSPFFFFLHIRRWKRYHSTLLFKEAQAVGKGLKVKCSACLGHSPRDQMHDFNQYRQVSHITQKGHTMVMSQALTEHTVVHTCIKNEAQESARHKKKSDNVSLILLFNQWSIWNLLLHVDLAWLMNNRATFDQPHPKQMLNMYINAQQTLLTVHSTLPSILPNWLNRK